MSPVLRRRTQRPAAPRIRLQLAKDNEGESIINTDHRTSDRFADALGEAERLHRRQTRKGTSTPYISHLLAAAGLVLEWGGDEDVAIAALLHDAVEDQGGQATADRIRARFGDHVADIVLACTDSVTSSEEEKAPWEERKLAHIAEVRHASREVAMVTAADKFHNLTCILRDVRRDGPAALERFKRPDRVLWYYEAMVEALDAHADVVPVGDLRRILQEVGELARAPIGTPQPE